MANSSKHQLFQVPRQCIQEQDAEAKPKPIQDCRDIARYVLLGEPGSGKTTAFEHESKESADAYYVAASDFISLNKITDWQGKTLFIDGLDETRAGQNDARTPLDAIRSKLQNLDIQRYRISCREADWYGNRDEQRLYAATGEVAVLHLCPLTDGDVRLILDHEKERVPDPETFLGKTEVYGLTNLLQNPQTLDMLIEATKGGQSWPNSKTEVYQLACESLVKEFNEEHLIANQNIVLPTDELLSAASELYAVLLIANATEFTTSQHYQDGIVSINQLKPTNISAYHQVLKTRLFNPIAHDRYAPVHRSISEYLAAKFIAQQIEKGLPVRRVLSLLTGFDQGVVAALRGLFAWLARVSNQARQFILEVDPLGIVLYGDVKDFSVSDKIQLLAALKNQADKAGIHYRHPDGRAFAAIIAPEMTDYLAQLLDQNSHEKSEQEVLMCILDGLMHAPPVFALKDGLLKIIRDGRQATHARWQALKVLVGFNDYPILLALADEIRLNKIEDQTDDLLVCLLRKLFPQHIDAKTIFDYLSVSQNSRGAANYALYWNHDFLEQVSDEQLPILLDDLASRDGKLLKYSEFRDLYELAGKLLLRGLKIYGEIISAQQLFRWLNIGLDEDIDDYQRDESSPKIKAWLEEHPQRILEIMEIGLAGATKDDETYLASRALWDAIPPDNVGLWWLEQALSAKNESVSIGCYRQAFWSLNNQVSNAYLSLEFLEEWVEKHPEFKGAHESQIAWPIETYRFEHAVQRRKWKLKHAEEIKARLKFFEEHKASIQDGSAPASVLHYLASAYFEHYANVNGKTGIERLTDFLAGDEALIATTLKGLRLVLNRTDLPEPQEVFDLAVKQRHHYIRLPFLVAIAENFQENASFLETLSDELAVKAIAFWYSYGAGNEPAWVKALIIQRPELSAKIMIEYMSTMFAKKVSFIYGHYALARDADYHEVAKLVVMPLLEKYPTKGLKDQASCLESLLKAAIRYCDHNILLALTSKKLTRKSLDVLQRVYWLATGLIIAPLDFEEKIKEYVTQSPERIDHLASFLYSGWHARHENYELRLSTVELLIVLLAPRSSPRWPDGGGLVTNAMHQGDYVNSLIRHLSENPDKEAGQVIERLIKNPALSDWHETLRSTSQVQVISRREATYRHPNVTEVVCTLNAGEPTNVADLAALVLDMLDKLAIEMHTTNLELYTRFWNQDTFGRTTTPKAENSCRNYIAEKLKDKLSKLGVEVDPEALAADSKRSDIRLTYRNKNTVFHLPIEMKCNSNRELWTAIHRQLIPKYTRSVETQGRGIYLVLWFDSEKMPAPPTGRQVKKPEELSKRLIASMSQPEQRMIDVFVLDVSKNKYKKFD